jgi:hypothetical protein
MRKGHPFLKEFLGRKSGGDAQQPAMIKSVGRRWRNEEVADKWEKDWLLNERY